MDYQKSFGGGVDANAYTALKQLQDAASSNGFSMPLISGYRSYDYQTSLYNNYVAIDGEDAANRYSANLAIQNIKQDWRLILGN